MTSEAFQIRRRVQMCEVDAFAVVWHGNYLAYCDDARAELLRAYGIPPSTLAEMGYLAVVADAHCRFHAPARFDDEIEIHTRIPKVRGSKLSFAFAIRRHGTGELLARIETMLVLLRRNGDLVYLLPEEIAGPVQAMVREQPGGLGSDPDT